MLVLAQNELILKAIIKPCIKVRKNVVLFVSVRVNFDHMICIVYIYIDNNYLSLNIQVYIYKHVNIYIFQLTDC